MNIDRAITFSDDVAVVIAMFVILFILVGYMKK